MTPTHSTDKSCKVIVTGPINNILDISNNTQKLDKLRRVFELVLPSGYLTYHEILFMVRIMTPKIGLNWKQLKYSLLSFTSKIEMILPDIPGNLLSRYIINESDKKDYKLYIHNII